MSTFSPDHRIAIVAQEDWAATLARFDRLVQPSHHHIVVTTQPCAIPERYCCDFSALKKQLGQNYDAVLLDLSHGLHLNALAIMVGTIRGGGVLVLYLGEDWLNQPDQELARFLPWPLDIADHLSVYKSLFYQTLNDSRVFHDHWPVALTPYMPIGQTPTEDQQRFVQQVTSQGPSVHLLMAARGRGKSYALAELLFSAYQQGQRIVCSASSPINMATLAEHFQTLSGEPVPFMAPDALLQQSDRFDLLVVDEAASLPLPQLNQLALKGSRVVFSSTDYGYEGSGRGFGISFIGQLNAQQHKVYTHTLQTPIRWGENDPLENWLDQLLFSPYQIDAPTHEQPQTICGQEWRQYPHLLDQAFSLLVTAHYQTSPDNKRWLVDDPSVICFLTYAHDRVVGVALIVQEGPLPHTLAEQVRRGERRPRGHLLPQSLLAHEGISQAGAHKYWRVSRIAIAPTKQNQGIGSALLDQIARTACAQQVDFLATSFAATPAVTYFWGKNGFQTVRLGSAKDQASGAYSLMMLKGLNHAREGDARLWAERFSQRWLQALPLGLQTLSVAQIIAISHTCHMGEIRHMPSFAAQDFNDLRDFSLYHRPYSSVRPALLNLGMHKLAHQQLQENCPEDRLLLGCSLNVYDETQAHALGYSGKKAFYQALKKSVQHHLERL